MKKKRSGFFRRVRRSLKQMRYKTHRQVSLMILLAMFLATAVLPPAFAHIAAENSIVQSLPDAQELVEQGRTLYSAERFNDAARVLQQAAAAFEATGDGLQQAMTLSNLSLAYQKLGQWPQATGASAQSLNLLKTGQNLGTATERMQILAQALEVQGRLQMALSKAQAALTTWQQAADTYAQVGSEAGVIRSRINIASAEQALGLYRQAQKTLTESTQLLRNQPDSTLKAIGLRNLGNVLRVVGDLKASRQVLQQSLEVATRLQSPIAISDALLGLGNITRVQQDTQAALEFYRQAATASTSPTTKSQALLNQLSLLLETKQFPAARALWPQVLSQISNLPPSRTAVYARIDLAQSLMKLGSRGAGGAGGALSGARNKLLCLPAVVPECTSAQLLATAVQQAKSLSDQRAESYALGTLGGLYEQTLQRSDAIDLTQQALLITQAIDAKDIAYRWQWQLGRLLREQGNIQGAIAAYTEAVNNLNLLRSDLVAINPKVQFDFRDEVEPVYRQLVDLLLQSQGTFEPSQENLQKARNTIESLQLAELENFFRSACIDAKPEQIDRIVDVDDPTAAVIYPIILSERLEVILKLPGQAKLRHYVTKKSQNEVESTLEQLWQYLREPDRTNDVKKLSQQVYSWLIQPLESELGKSKVGKLVFVPDGALRNIPMAVLYSEKQQQYLIEKYAIALTPGLQLLEPKRLQRERLNALTAGLSESREVSGREFPRLENVRFELEQISSEVSKSEELFNQAFTKTNLQKQLEKTPFSVVHLATHGQFSSNLEETFILTWDQLLKINDLENLLKTSDSSAIELLVLSACETATGDKRATLGLAGIAVRAGARSTLATLWSVDDQSTALLMSEFYRQLANTNVTKAEALQRAQLALWTNNSQDLKRPYFWAAYVLVGNWL